MSIFGSIMSKIFGGSTASPAGAEAISAASATPATPASTPATEPQAAAPAQQNVDVEAVLTDLASKKGEKLNWHESIVDLMKLLDLDSSLAARKELAKELNYTGDTEDSAKMNVWLHREVTQKLAANGGKLPASMQA